MSGRLIVFEGIDGSGKTIQTALFADRLRASGQTVSTHSFPNYDTVYGRAIAGGLHGRGVNFRSVDPKLVSLFFMADRGLAVPGIRRSLLTGTTVLCNRYVASNVAYQGARIDDETKRRRFTVWAERTEYTDLGHPKPDLVLFLDVPPDVSAKLRQTRKRAEDGYEADLAFQGRVSAIYRTMAESQKTWSVIRCTDEAGAILPPERIHEAIWALVEPMLAARSAV
ncbi:MAG: dTMP kinase [Candidatus Kerfeldbacteria bacterium]|nr:dTMP kinase [Candidatus Kerfeldbacteria bacterium]